MGVYKYGFILTAIHDLVTSLCVVLSIPKVISRNSYVIFIATGHVSNFPYGQILLIILFQMMFLSLLILTNSFIYRYIHICKVTKLYQQFTSKTLVSIKSIQLFEDTKAATKHNLVAIQGTQLSYIYTRRKCVIVLFAVNILILLNCGLIMVVCSWPNAEFREQLYSEQVEFDISALKQKSFLGFSMKHSVNTLTIILVIDGMLMMSVFSVIGSYCTWGIRSMFKNTSLSNNTKKAHRKMLRILLLQSTCPTVLLYAPTSVCYVLLFASVPATSSVTDALGITLLLYPLFNPLVTIFCVKDYRRFLINAFVKKKPTLNVQSIGLADRNVYVPFSKTTN
ncbi:hypothetical protein Y032_0066g3728 [Ancylostoma ceylanicum]|uniref:G-protein coupled receptors family 1 profile domain-containing protein n=1 Tax=Ancylostoma ceylanicum TaxID=53326 RepID=A0A016U0I6_9BILA|nr:hypothetical protein Y032_0066g3728 [Ancylostoma ceylanicum]